MKRWTFGRMAGVMEASAGGEFVLYDDARRAVAEAEQRWIDAIAAHGDRIGADMYQQGQRDERARIRAAVEALWASAHRLMSDGHYSYVVPTAEDVLAVIDAGGES